jgi:hypothetical protein
LNAGRIELLEHPRLAAQLASLERRTARGGRDSIDHSPGAHDDIANAVAGVTVALAGGPGLMRHRGIWDYYRQAAAALKIAAAARCDETGNFHPDTGHAPIPFAELRCSHGVYPPAACRACWH